MEKQYLDAYKEKVDSLTPEEQKLRDVYLSKFATGEIQGPTLNYPTISKPQLQYYKMDEYVKNVPKKTITQALVENNADNLDGIAHEYFLTKKTYGKFISTIEDLTKSLAANGVSKGKSVTVCMAGIPEAYESLYACGWLGAIGIFIAPYLDKATMISDIKKDNSKILIIMDALYEKFKDTFDEVIEECGIERVVMVPTLNSSFLGKLKKPKKYDNDKIVMYNDFLKEGRNYKTPEMVEYEPNMPAAVVYSSGTTGVLKGVLLSHDSINNSAISYLPFGFDLSRDQKFYQAIPVWSSTGLVADGTSIFYYGATLHEDPRFEPDVFSKNIGKYRDNWGIATTELFNGITKLKLQRGFNFKLKTGLLNYENLKNVYIGGTPVTPKGKERLANILQSVGCSAQVNSSYGTCENGSIVTAELNGYKYPRYSVGIPIPGATVMIVDDENREVPYGERGEITISTPCEMLDYYNRPDLSEKLYFTSGKKVFKHTGDIGYILPDGTLIYEGRAKDFSMVGDKKIYNFDVKMAILDDDDILDCEVFLDDNQEFRANIIFCEGVVVENLEEKISSIQKRVFDKLKDNDCVPKEFKVWNEFPMARSTKRDYDAIKNDNREFIRMDFEPEKIHRM